MQRPTPDVPDLDAQELQEALDEGRSLLVVYYADWCGFSRAFLPTFEDRADELPVPVAAANISSPQDPRWAKHAIRTVPSMVLYEDGQETERVDGHPGRGLKSEDIDRLTQHAST